jgi:hypothetical protein
MDILNDFTNYYPKRVRNILKLDGDVQITGMTIMRTPIQSAIETALNYLSLGTFKSENNPYEKMFHLYMLIELSNNKKYVVEKNQVINVSTSLPETTKDTQTMEINKTWLNYDGNGKNIVLTMNTMFENTLKGIGTTQFFEYSAFGGGRGGNCQDFILGLLKYNGLSHPVLTDFIKQNIERLVRAMPIYVSWFSKLITDIGKYADLGRQELGFKNGGRILRNNNNNHMFGSKGRKRIV